MNAAPWGNPTAIHTHTHARTHNEVQAVNIRVDDHIAQTDSAPAHALPLPPYPTPPRLALVL